MSRSPELSTADQEQVDLTPTGDEELEEFLAEFSEEEVASLDDGDAVFSVRVRVASGVGESRTYDEMVYEGCMTADDALRSEIIIMALFEPDLNAFDSEGLDS